MYKINVIQKKGEKEMEENFEKMGKIIAEILK